MKKTGIIRVKYNLGDKPIDSGTDWVAVAALTDEEIHKAALSDPDAQPLPIGKDDGLIKLPNVKKLRERLELTQEEFSATYRIPLGTLRDWEQRRKYPDAPARAYLTIIAKNPEAVAKLLRDAA
jgi:putative transcriptional regulator